MGFVTTQEDLERYYGLGVRVLSDARMLAVVFQTTPETQKRLLPPPLEPADSPTGLMFVADYATTNLGPGYLEAALFLHCSFAGEAGSHCLSMPITNEARMHNGRDIFGFPKKLADVHLEREGQTARGWVERHGIRFVDIAAELTGTLPELPPQAPNFLFKGMPRADLQPGFDGPVFLVRQQTEVVAASVEIGAAKVATLPSADDPWDDVEIVDTHAAIWLESENTLQPGAVVAEVDAEAYLPHYFRTTDFRAGG